MAKRITCIDMSYTFQDNVDEMQFTNQLYINNVCIAFHL